METSIITNALLIVTPNMQMTPISSVLQFAQVAQQQVIIHIDAKIIATMGNFRSIRYAKVDASLATLQIT